MRNYYYYFIIIILLLFIYLFIYRYSSNLFIGFAQTVSKKNEQKISLMPNRFLENLDKYIAADAIIFQGVGFFDVGVMVFTRQWKKLASHVVQFGPKRRTEEELITLLKYRCTPVIRPEGDQPKVAVASTKPKDKEDKDD